MEPLEDGSYFFDRDGELFKYILEYMRTGGVLLPETWTRTDLLRLYQEADYFSMSTLSAVLLLKLFNSKIVTNDIMKEELIGKMKEIVPKFRFCVEGAIGNESVSREMCLSTQWTLQFRYDMKDEHKKHCKVKEKLKRALDESEISLLLMSTQGSGVVFGQLTCIMLDVLLGASKEDTLIFRYCDWGSLDRPEDPMKKNIEYVYKYRKLSAEKVREIVNVKFESKSCTFIRETYPLGLVSVTDDDDGEFHLLTDIFEIDMMLDYKIDKIEVWRIPTLPLDDILDEEQSSSFSSSDTSTS